MSKASRVLVIRFSAMGDVAMTAPILKELSVAYPDTELVVLSRALFEPFFADVPGMSFHAFQPKTKHKGFLGLVKLFFELRKYKITAVADLHNNLRSAILCILFFLTGVRLKRLDKGRAQKKDLTRYPDKTLVPLKLTSERYADVFRALGYSFKLSHKLPFRQPAPIATHLLPFIALEKSKKYVGVSPFAQHLQKVYPLEKMERIVASLAALGHQVIIFGGGPQEEAIAAKWQKDYSGVQSAINKINLQQELDLISHLDVMISMDSSGMHMASLKGIPVISLWGATHPYAGFMGYGQSMSDAAQIDLDCRPCSIYGNKPCFRGDFACMNNLPESFVLDLVTQKLHG